MDNKVLWFVLGGGVAYLLLSHKAGLSLRGGVNLTTDSSGGYVGGVTRGSESSSDYSPLGTVSSYPGAGKFGFGAYLGFGGGGTAGSSGGFAAQSPSGIGGAQTYGVQNQPAQQCNGCFGGEKA